jgi:hypothetical protein
VCMYVGMYLYMSVCIIYIYIYELLIYLELFWPEKYQL